MPKYNVRRKAQLGLAVTDGGTLTPIAPNMYLAQGRTHDDGGIGISYGKKYNAGGDLEIEDKEILQVVGGNTKFVGNGKFKGGGQEASIRVFSSVPFLRGVSPAKLVMGGANPDAVFKAQEEFKDKNRINDDGTTYEVGGEKIYTPSKSIQRQIQETGNITIGGAPTIDGLRTFGYLRGLTTARKYGAKGSLIFRAGKELIKRGTQKLVDNGKITKEVAQIPRSIYGQFIGAYGQNLPKTIGLINNMEQKRFGGSKQDDTKTAALKHLRNKFTIHGNYNGGMFGGAGAGSVIMPQPEFITDTITKRYLVPVTQNFNDAFGNAVDAGLDKFMFDNKWYNTKKSNNLNNNAAGAARTQTVYLPVEHKEVRRRKKEFGGNMIYTINGNVKNGLSHRPKAKYGKIDKKDKDTKVGQDGLIYKRAADGEWYTDGTKHVTYKPISKNSRKDLYYANPVQGLYHDAHNDGSFANVSSLVPDEYETITRKFDKPKRTHVSGYAFEDEEKETKKIGSLTYEKNEDGQWVPASKQSTTTTRDGGRPKDFGMTRTGVNHPNGSYKYHPLTGEKISEMGIVETSEPSVKGTTKVSSKSSSTARGRGTKASTPKAAARTTTKGADVKYGTPLKEKKESLYITGIKNDITTPLRAGMEKIKSPSSTGGGTQSKDGRWIGQYKNTNVGDWIGLGSNLAGSVASYFMTKNTINKMPEPLKPVMTPAVKLKTKYNIQPQLTNISEAEQMNRASVRRNTQSSNTSLAREQRLMNEARGTKNTLYGQKENIETQLINQDKLNRQSVMRDDIRAYNDYLNRVTATKTARNQLKVSNINNLISGLTSSVNNILGTIESRKATNNTLRAIAAANPNVDARLIGGFDYYIDPITKKKYNKNQQYVGTING